MKSFFWIVILGIIVVGVGIQSLTFYSQIKKMRAELVLEREISERAREKVENLKGENKSLIRECEKLRSDLVSYLSLNTKLTEENKRLNKEIEKLQKTIKDKDMKLKEMEKKMKEKKKELGKKTLSEDKKKDETRKKIEILKKKIKDLEETLKKERASYHYNLGVAYTKAGLYVQAIEAYKKALEFDSKNYLACYNLGLLYEKIKKDFPHAIFYYRKYLELNPEAKDKEEISSLIHDLLSKETAEEN